MPERASIYEMVAELQALMRRRYDAGVSAELECDVEAAERGVVLTARARIFAPARTLAALEPVLGCEDLPDFGNPAFAERGSATGYRDYALKMRSDNLKPGKPYHLTLHPSPGAEPIASCTVYAFSKSTVVRARRQIREIILDERRAKAAPRRPRRR